MKRGGEGRGENDMYVGLHSGSETCMVRMPRYMSTLLREVPSDSIRYLVR